MPPLVGAAGQRELRQARIASVRPHLLEARIRRVIEIPVRGAPRAGARSAPFPPTDHPSMPRVAVARSPRPIRRSISYEGEDTLMAFWRAPTTRELHTAPSIGAGARSADAMTVHLRAHSASRRD